MADTSEGAAKNEMEKILVHFVHTFKILCKGSIFPKGISDNIEGAKTSKVVRQIIYNS